MSRSLAGKIVVVTGASRGVGKGIALELGAAGATVYVTGRSVAAGPLPGTVSETADEVTALGGKGIAVVCDHHSDEQVAAVFERVHEESGRLDLLVNNVFSSPDLGAWLGKSFWELPLAAWDQVLDIGTRSHYVASVSAAPLLFAAGRGLIVNISSAGARQYSHNTVYGVGKAALDKMTADMAVELRPQDVSVVSVWPGLVRTELVDAAARRADHGRSEIELPGEGRFDVGAAESPRFVGRGVAALAADPAVRDRSGSAVSTRDLARHYGFTDVDGAMPAAMN
ncbi:SDR family NAD(P)-dependent oxidoreductase [Streptomyces sp. NBC_01637]|uniref:SDR family NAD(P)-dependent oxidoreductase n=1 Tax=unclassified Streptomyces TaxID=2593676 RepID=UPI003868ED21|nr:SDR family NAD(P)-dependent oxidoreductase [Streptomyces sp. NBC_01653]WTC84624.1 SDR family NAD(P)-dependent oxidoreductase [Streptomyces sp. NBC_01653]WTD86244.1 SDR family NAD(P)-dependent oxidoreductase [Streptomyces sp. NBC_01637]WTD94281.1 SDR family NAD(P)-dependent oxidoreductase [Streptomyces sp. NBC_01637]